MLRLLILALIVSLCACSSSEPSESDEPSGDEALTVADVLEDCVVTDVADLSEILTLLQGLLQDSEGPTPEIDLIAGILQGGVFPWSLDVDQDGTPDLEGEIWFQNGDDVTLPLDLDDLNNIDTNDLAGAIAAILGNIPPGLTFHLRFEFNDPLFDGDGAGEGEGELVFLFGEDTISSTSGDGALTLGDCDFEFFFDDIGFDDIAEDGFPIADVGFETRIGPQTLFGELELDGSNIARIRARLGKDGIEEIFEFDLSDPAGGLIE